MKAHSEKENSKKLGKMVLDDVLEKRLGSYAALAVAAGVSVLACVEPAYPDVVFTPSDSVVECHRPDLPIDINGDGIIDFTLFWGADSYHTTNIRVRGAKGNAVIGIGKAGEFAQASALEPGALINKYRNVLPANTYINSNDLFYHFPQSGLLMAGSVFGRPKGPFASKQNRALGVRFRIGFEDHFAWIGFRYFQKGCTAKLGGLAYETLPDHPIRAGQTHGTSDDVTLSQQSYEDSNVPIPATPAVLSLGSEGLKLWRKKQN